MAERARPQARARGGQPLLSARRAAARLRVAVLYLADCVQDLAHPGRYRPTCDCAEPRCACGCCHRSDALQAELDRLAQERADRAGIY